MKEKHDSKDIEEDFTELVKSRKFSPEFEKAWFEYMEKSLQDVASSEELKKKGIKGLEELINNYKGQKESGDQEKFLEILSFLKANKENLLKILDPGKKKQEKFRQSGHFIDQKLKYQYPEKEQMTIFDYIESSRIKNKIDKYEYEVKAVGVRLTPPEDKLLNAMQKLLHEKSQHDNPEGANYYKGNAPTDLVPFGNEKKQSPVLRIRPAELYKAYLDNEDYSGQDIKFIKSVLFTLSTKKFLMIFDRKRKVEKGGKIEVLTDRIEEFQSLVQVIKYTEGLEEGELKKINSGDDSIYEIKGELILGFNPILVEQINAKYVEYPPDINRRMVISAGGHKLVTEAMNLLRDFMLRELSSKRYKTEINEERLPYILKLEKYLKARQKKRVQQRITDAIHAVKNLGLITSAELTTGKAGQMKYVFSLNPDFQ